LRGKGHGSFQESAVDGYAKYLLDRRLATEKTAPFYLHWVRRYRDFMTHLAVEDRVSASTQNQAFNAILFLFRHVLGKDIEDIGKKIGQQNLSKFFLGCLNGKNYLITTASTRTGNSAALHCQPVMRSVRFPTVDAITL
jgi:hypothetical protein